MQTPPSVGRIVHYQRFGSPGGEYKSEPSPAIITQVLDEHNWTCQLTIFNPSGLYMNPAPFAEHPTPGHWNWPPRV